jgi:hypothetical protein
MAQSKLGRSKEEPREHENKAGGMAAKFRC